MLCICGFFFVFLYKSLFIKQFLKIAFFFFKIPAMSSIVLSSEEIRGEAVTYEV